MFVCQEHAPMPAGFGALRDDDIGAVLLQPDRLLHNGGAATSPGARRLDALQQRLVRQSEMKADDFRL